LVPFKLIGSTPQRLGEVFAWSNGEIVGLNAHAHHSGRVPLKFVDEDPKAMRIIFGMMLPARRHSRLTHTFVADFESGLA
jgi:hypothetical protein